MISATRRYIFLHETNLFFILFIFILQAADQRAGRQQVCFFCEYLLFFLGRYIESMRTDPTSLGPIYSWDFYPYSILHTIVLVPKTPLANKLFANTRCQPWRPAAWPVPSPVAWGRPNPVHRRHPHTMGKYACAWFGSPHATARVVGCNQDSKKMLLFWRVFCLTLASFYLGLCVSGVCRPNIQPTTNHLADLISPSIMGGWQCFN
jgi:hypothetical protein